MSLPPSKSPPRQSLSPRETVVEQQILRAISGIVFGPTGCGKTSFLANWPRCGFIIDSQEQGIYYLVERGLVPPPVFIWEIPNSAKGWDAVVEKVGLAALQDIDTLNIETITGFEAICFLDHANRHYKASDIGNPETGFYSFQKGPKNTAKFDFPKLIDAANVCLRSGKNVWISGHSMQKEEISYNGIRYQKNIPVAEKEIWVRLARWASIVAFYGLKIEQDTEASRGALKKTATPNIDRLLYVDQTPYCEAKNWFGLQGVINAGKTGLECYQNFTKALERRS